MKHVKSIDFGTGRNARLFKVLLIKDGYLLPDFLPKKRWFGRKFLILLFIIFVLSLLSDSTESGVSLIMVLLLAAFFLFKIVKGLMTITRIHGSSFLTAAQDYSHSLDKLTEVPTRLSLNNEKCYFCADTAWYEPRVVESQRNRRGRTQSTYGYLPIMFGHFYITDKRLLFIGNSYNAGKKEIKLDKLLDYHSHTDGLLPISDRQRAPFIRLTPVQSLEAALILKHLKQAKNKL
jgi:hypothetical protein